VPVVSPLEGNITSPWCNLAAVLHLRSWHLLDCPCLASRTMMKTDVGQAHNSNPQTVYSHAMQFRVGSVTAPPGERVSKWNGPSLLPNTTAKFRSRCVLGACMCASTQRRDAPSIRYEMRPRTRHRVACFCTSRRHTARFLSIRSCLVRRKDEHGVFFSHQTLEATCAGGGRPGWRKAGRQQWRCSVAGKNPKLLARGIGLGEFGGSRASGGARRLNKKKKKIREKRKGERRRGSSSRPSQLTGHACRNESA
jgi:hypothetical protein